MTEYPLVSNNFLAFSLSIALPIADVGYLVDSMMFKKMVSVLFTGLSCSEFNALMFQIRFSNCVYTIDMGA